ncbi:alpha/beta hydrolase family protein [Psychroflexus aestuariivivens]|uniref:alpha/beta hydrolase family protein n=1 Tax=Psychroflexus aestuariivivens TaxID=1795040 RepID=UPI000FDCCE9C|nr:alpha/beta hydrolase-fold protein [Psychroflexus aestuariivivens]
MLKKETLTIEGSSKKKILIDYRYKTDEKNQPIMIFCHGYKGFKDWGAWNLIFDKIAKTGIAVIKFNFSHNGGTIEKPIDFPNLEDFANDNYSKQLYDLERIIEWTKSYFDNSAYLDLNKLSLVGHSRGGGIILLKAATNSNISKVVTWSGVSDFKSRFPKGQDFENWKNKGVYYVKNGRTGQMMPHNFQFFEDFQANEKILNIKSACEKLEIPVKIIHGQADESVKIEEAYLLDKYCSNSELSLIANANHVYNTKHPWNEEDLPEPAEELIRQTVDFISK